MSAHVPLAAPARPTSPFKGLASFEDSELDELLFFGRERERRVIAANLVAARLTVLYGPSGVGKSSVLRAGVARDLRTLPEQPLVVVADAWTEPAGHAIAGAIATAAGIAPGPLSETIELAAALHGDVYLLLDQVEQYFVYHGDDPGLGDALAELVNRHELPIHVLVGIREDALARLDSCKKQVPGLLANRLRLEHLSVDAGRRAIVGPVERFGTIVPEEEGLAVEPELVEAVLAGVRTGVLVARQRGRGTANVAGSHARVETPYLQVVMQRLWEVERAVGSRVLRRSTLDRLGGPGHIVEEHLERALTALTPEQKALAARMFNHLVTPSGMKIAHGTSDLAGYVASTEEELQPVLVALGRERILRPVRDGRDDVAHEIFHDVLADAVLAWRAAFNAEQALARERVEARRRHRRLLVIVGVALAALVVMVAITAYALSQRSEAERSAALAQQNAELAKHNEEIAEKNEAAATQSAAALAGTQAKLTSQVELAKKESARAESEAKTAKRAVKEADDANAAAQKSESEAEDALQVAETAEKEARAGASDASLARARADARRAEAERARRKADASLKLAEKRRAEAAAARREADAKERLASTTALALEAVTLLASQPEASLAKALEAANLDSSPLLVEHVMRRALLATRGLRVLEGSSGPMRDAEFNADGTRIVTAGDAAVFDAASGRELGRLETGSQVRMAAFSPDRATIVTATRDGRAMLWDAASFHAGPVLVHAADRKPITGAAFSHDGRLVVTTGTNETAKVWTVQDGKLWRRLVLRRSVDHAEFSRDDTRLLTLAGGVVRVFDLGIASQSRAELFPPLTQPAAITDAHFSPTEDLIVTTGRDRTARLWDASDGRLRNTLQGAGQVLSAAFSADGTLLVTVGTDGDARVWDVKTGELVTPLVGHLTSVVGAAFSPDASLVATAGDDGTARLWSLPDGVQQAILLGHTGPLATVTFDHGGTRLLTASADGTARTWDTRIDRRLQRLGEHDGEVTALAFSREGGTLASAGDDGFVRLWSLAGGDPLAPIDVGVPLNDVAFDADGSRLAAAGSDGRARVWSMADRTLVSGDLRQDGEVHSVALSPDGRTIATAGDDGMTRIRPVRGGDGTALAHPGVVLDVAFSADGELVATGGVDNLARIWRASTGKLLRTLEGHRDDVTSVAFSADGKRLATGSADHDAQIWDVATGEPIRLLHGHAAIVSDVGFSADGRWVVTAGPAKAGIWAAEQPDLPNNRLTFLDGHDGQLTAAAFIPLPHGWLVATAATDGTVRTYSCGLCGKTPQLAAIAHKRLDELRAE